MKQRGIFGVTLLLALGAIAGCTHSDSPGGAATALPSTSPSAQRPEHFVADNDVALSARSPFYADWSVNVNDPATLREFSSAVVSGRVIGVERTFVDANAAIATTYSIQVENVYKGDDMANVISVTLPGGTVPLGEYIASLDEMGRYEMKLGRKDPERFPGASQEDPRTMDPALPVTENWGMNPASASMLAELQPDSWVIYLGATEGDMYFGAAFDHALSYLKDGLVHTLHPEAERATFPESELFGE